MRPFPWDGWLVRRARVRVLCIALRVGEVRDGGGSLNGACSPYGLCLLERYSGGWGLTPPGPEKGRRGGGGEARKHCLFCSRMVERVSSTLAWRTHGGQGWTCTVCRKTYPWEERNLRALAAKDHNIQMTFSRKKNAVSWPTIAVFTLIKRFLLK